MKAEPEPGAWSHGLVTWSWSHGLVTWAWSHGLVTWSGVNDPKREQVKGQADLSRPKPPREASRTTNSNLQENENCTFYNIL